MPAAPNAPSQGFVLDHASNTVRFERDFAADRSLVFEAWTRPEHVALWWDAAGHPLTRCEIDLRVGGSFTFVVRDHPEMPFAGVYREIVPNDRLVFDALGSIGRITLRERGQGTHMVVEIVCNSAAQLEQFVQMGVAVGTSATLDNLVRHLGEVVAPVS
jgi:uncharacterized protein YndB with AHSA1/START domain